MNSVGVLALQGCIEPHASRLRELNCNVTYVRDVSDFEKIDRLIIPGGESTSMLRLIDRNQIEQALIDFGSSKPIWGVCAGAILIATEVIHPSQRSFGFMQIRAERNHYGSQIDSFSTEIDIPALGFSPSVDFIRAPKLEALNSSVEILSSYNSEAILLRQGRHLASSFHIELRNDNRLHQYFLTI